MPGTWVLIKVTLPVQLSHLLLNLLREERARITPKTAHFQIDHILSYTRNLEALRALNSSWMPFGPLDFVR